MDNVYSSHLASSISPTLQMDSINIPVNKYLRKEIFSNICERSLAEVASFSLDGCITAEGAAKEAAEWSAAEKVATLDMKKSEIALEGAQLRTNTTLEKHL